MKKISIIISSTALLLLSGLVACKKYKDPDGKDLGLTNKYCNDPLAANFNQGFPGTPDNSVCVYPADTFVGNWMLLDSVFLPDLTTFVAVHNYNLVFAQQSLATDSFRNKLSVSGFCSNGNKLNLTANKYNLALTDSLIDQTLGQQFFCQNTDTVSGSFKVVKDSLTTKMNILLTESNPSGTFIHVGTAIKQ